MLWPSRRRLELLAATETFVISALAAKAIAADRALPSVAVTVAVPVEVLLNVAVALPSLPVVAGELTVPRLVAKLTDLPATGTPVVVSVAVRVIVAASLPLAMIDVLFDEMFRLIPRRVMEVLPELPPAVAWTVPLLLSESAASAV